MGIKQQYLSKVEPGIRGCDRWLAQKLAEALAVGLRELQTELKLEAVVSGSGDPRRIGNRSLHLAYLQLLLTQKADSAYVALSEEELEEHCESLSWEGVLEVVSSRRREVEFLEEVLRGAVPHPEMRLYFEEVLGAYPEQDIRLLAAARSKEPSEKGREELASAMRELL
jgi:hypothetical protein